MTEETEITRSGDKPRFFGRRRGKKLRRGALGLMETLLPRLAIAPPGQGVVLTPQALFTCEVQTVWLEIGFGGGEHVVAQAGLHPQTGIIGCEPFRNGIASLLNHLNTDPKDNVRIFPDDARQLFPALPEASLGRVFVLFPDPWPKKRHADRRFVCDENLDSLARLMADGAELRVASDDPVYQEWAAEHLAKHPLLEEIQVTNQRDQLPHDWPVTRYEEKCLAGRAPVFFRYRRKARA